MLGVKGSIQGMLENKSRKYDSAFLSDGNGFKRNASRLIPLILKNFETNLKKCNREEVAEYKLRNLNLVFLGPRRKHLTLALTKFFS